MRNSNPPTSQHAPQITLPPQNIEAEMAVLGSILLGGRKVVEDVMVYLTPERFYRAMHTQIFAAVLALYQEGVEIDAVTIQAKLDGLGVMGAIGQSYLLGLMGSEATPANAAHYAKIVLEAWKLRAFHEGVSELAGVALGRSEEEPDSRAICTKARTLLDEIERAGRRAVGEGGLRSILSAVWDDLDDRHANWKAGGSGLRGLTTGFIDLDWITGGLQAGDLIVIAGRPSSGKSALFMDMAARQAKIGARVAIASLEMSKESLVERMLSSLALVSSNKIRSGNLSDEEYSKITTASQAIYDMDMEISDASDQSVEDIRAWARSIHAKGGLDALYIDYLGLIRMASVSGNRSTDLGVIMKALKNIAKELSIPVIVLSQLSRNVERRDDKRPILSDLKDSGDIEADADLVFGIYRASYYARKEEAEEGVEVVADSEEAEVIALKQRNGATGTVRLLFRAPFVRFDNLARHPAGL